jgi:hypothetical protein
VQNKTNAFAVILTICGMVCGAKAGTFMYKDIRKPGGHERDLSALARDAQFCDQKIGVQTGEVSPEYNKCMRSRGWRFSHTDEQSNSKEDPAQKDAAVGHACRQEWSVFSGYREVCEP